MGPGVLAVGLHLGGPATAQSTYVGVTPPRVAAVDPGAVRAARAQPAVAQATTRPGGLALTGADVLQLLSLAGACVAIGSVAIRVSRFRRPA